MLIKLVLLLSSARANQIEIETHIPRIITILKIPIPIKEPFALIQYTPLPIERTLRILSIVDILTTYIAYTLDHYEYTTLYSLDCIIIENAKICKQQNIIRPVSTADDCETRLITNSTEKCTYKTFALSNDYINKITTNVWHIIPTSEINFNLICNQFIKDILLSKPTIVKLEKGCALRNEKFKLISTFDSKTVHYSFINFSEPLPELNISEDLLPRYNLYINTFNDLKQDALNLEQLNDKLNKFHNAKREHSWRQAFSNSLSYFGYFCICLCILYVGNKLGLFGILSMILQYLAAKSSRCCCKNHSEPIVSYNNCSNIIHHGRTDFVPQQAQNLPLVPAHLTHNDYME